VLNRTIAEIQGAYTNETDPLVFEDLLVMEKKGKRRKVLKRWLKERIKSLEPTQDFRNSAYTTLSKPPKDKITGIPIIG